MCLVPDGLIGYKNNCFFRIFSFCGWFIPFKETCSWHRQALFLTDNGEWWEEVESQCGFRKCRRNLGDFVPHSLPPCWVSRHWTGDWPGLTHGHFHALFRPCDRPNNPCEIFKTLTANRMDLLSYGWVVLPLASPSTGSGCSIRQENDETLQSWAVQLWFLCLLMSTHFAALLKGSGSYPLGTRYFHFKMSNPEEDT